MGVITRNNFSIDSRWAHRLCLCTDRQKPANSFLCCLPRSHQFGQLDTFLVDWHCLPFTSKQRIRGFVAVVTFQRCKLNQTRHPRSRHLLVGFEATPIPFSPVLMQRCFQSKKLPSQQNCTYRNPQCMGQAAHPEIPVQFSSCPVHMNSDFVVNLASFDDHHFFLQLCRAEKPVFVFLMWPLYAANPKIQSNCYGQVEPGPIIYNQLEVSFLFLIGLLFPLMSFSPDYKAAVVVAVDIRSKKNDTGKVVAFVSWLTTSLYSCIDLIPINSCCHFSGSITRRRHLRFRSRLQYPDVVRKL